MRAFAAFFAAALVSLAAHAQSLVITTVAGGGVGDGSLAGNANINAPSAIAVDGRELGN